MVTMERWSTEIPREVQTGISAHRWESRPRKSMAEYRDTLNTTKDIASITKIETPGVSLNGAPKATGRGCGRRSQKRLIRVIQGPLLTSVSPCPRNTRNCNQGREDPAG